jgi:PleD family two-component response regulator
VPERHENPIPRLAHALLDAHSVISLTLASASPTGEAYALAETLSQLLHEAPEDHATIAQYIERQEQNIATMIQESNEREHEITRLTIQVKSEKHDVVDALESMLRMNAARLDSITTERRAQQALYQRLIGPIRPMGVILAETTTEPLRAAGA